MLKLLSRIVLQSDVKGAPFQSASDQPGGLPTHTAMQKSNRTSFEIRAGNCIFKGRWFLAPATSPNGTKRLEGYA
jgi:hypothetical protein